MSPPSYGSALLLGTTLLLAFTIISCNPQDAPTSEKIQRKAPAPSVQQLEVALPEHRILDERIYDVPRKTQVILDVLVSGEISRVGLMGLLNDLYSKTHGRRDFKYHNPPTHVFIYLYTGTEGAQSGMGEWIAMLSKIGTGGKPEIRINELQFAEMGVREDERFGLSEDQRKQIWWEMVKARHRSLKDIDRKYPMSGPFSWVQYEKRKELEESLTKKYKDKISKVYGLTVDQLDAIHQEGAARQWLGPTSPGAREYWMRIAPKLHGDHVVVRVETNLPKGSVIRANLLRYFLFEGEREQRVVELDTLGKENLLIVGDRTFELTMKARDDWIKRPLLMDRDKKIQRIFPSARVTVTFSTAWQPADVLAVVGGWGEKMTGKQVERWPTGGAITVEHPVDIPVRQ